MFAVFTVMRQLRELLWYLAEALSLVPAGPLRDEIDSVRERTECLTGAGPDKLVRFDANAYRQEIGVLLARVSEVVRAEVGESAPDHRGADLIGANLRRADLRGASFRGAYLLGADLLGADLRKADLLGADLRAADLRATDLEESIFLTQPQLDAAKGDTATRIPSSLIRPPHWPAAAPAAEQAAVRRRRRRPR
ncbi:pentapeptide repeat-containing protein [Longimycelium tulufanense]|nr:pentapeptide repeat-containing protein [Longimycelium tulufanense]